MIAVDGGYDTCRKYDIVPDLIVGDFDSVQESDMPQIAEIAKIAPDHVVLLPTEKDDTDMLAAIRIGLGEGCQEFCIYGGDGRQTRAYAGKPAVPDLFKTVQCSWVFDG